MNFFGQDTHAKLVLVLVVHGVVVVGGKDSVEVQAPLFQGRRENKALLEGNPVVRPCAGGDRGSGTPRAHGEPPGVHDAAEVHVELVMGRIFGDFFSRKSKSMFSSQVLSPE